MSSQIVDQQFYPMLFSWWNDDKHSYDMIPCWSLLSLQGIEHFCYHIWDQLACFLLSTIHYKGDVYWLLLSWLT